MRRKTVSGVMLFLLLIGVLILTFNIQPVKASGTIYIKADGSVEPDTAPISSVDNVTYTFTGNINDSIVVERDNIVVDGAGYTLQGTWSAMGLDLTERSNVTVRKMGIDTFHIGIYLYASSNINVTGNDVTNNHNGIYLWNSTNNTIVENNITDNSDNGVYLYLSSNNTFYGNTVAGNWYSGIVFDSSSYNCISGNRINFSPLGILLFWSANTNVAENNITYTSECAIKLEFSNENSISGNNVTINNHNGILLERSDSNILSRNTIFNSNIGIFLDVSSDNNSIIRNTITNNYEGVRLDCTQVNRVCKNNIAGNTMSGISLEWSLFATIYANTIKENNYDGIWLYDSNNTIYHNNFLDNSEQVHSFNSTNVWDDGYVSGGNYWSDYPGEDVNGEGIGDTPYVIDDNNQDPYPLIAPIHVFEAGIWNGVPYEVDFVSNSTVSDLYFNPDEGAFLRFNVTGESGTTGFCRVAIPRNLLWVENGWNVTINGEPTHPTTIIGDEDYTWICLTYQHDMKTIEVRGTNAIPELPSLLILPLFMIATLLAVIIYRRKHST